MNSLHIIELQSVVETYQSEAGIFTALKGIDLCVGAGEFLAIVGALGLTRTMSINVLERIREIAVMRAIGASSRSIMILVIVEGGLIALMSWVLGGLLALPLSRFLSHIVDIAFMQAPLRRWLSCNVQKPSWTKPRARLVHKRSRRRQLPSMPLRRSLRKRRLPERRWM